MNLMTVKENLHRLVDELPETELKAAQRFLEYLRDMSSDEEISVNERAESESAWQAYLSGADSGESLEQVRRESPPR